MANALYFILISLYNNSHVFRISLGKCFEICRSIAFSYFLIFRCFLHLLLKHFGLVERSCCIAEVQKILPPDYEKRVGFKLELADKKEELPIETPPHARSILGHLVMFALALMLPLIIFSSLLIWHYSQAANRVLENDAQSYAKAMTDVMDNEIHTMIVLLTNGASCQESHSDLEELHDVFSHALQIREATLIYDEGIDRTFKKIGMLGGDVMHRDRSVDFLSRLKSQERYAVSSLLKANNGRTYTQISVPVFCDGEQKATLAINITPGYWKSIINRMSEWTAGNIGVVDRNARYIIISDDEHIIFSSDEEFMGARGERQGFQNLRLKMLNGLSGVVGSRSSDGTPTVLAFHRSVFSGWISVVEIPREIFNAPLRKGYTVLAISGGIFLFLSLIFAYQFGTRISKPVMQLASYAKRLGFEEPFIELYSPVSEVNEVSRLLSQSTSALENSYRALRESEERYRLATDVFQGAIVSYDGETGMIYCSPTYYEMFGNDMSWLKPVQDPELLMFHPDDREKLRAYLDSIFDSDIERQELEYRIKGPSGDWIWVWDRLAITRDENRAPMRIIGALLDITHRKVAEEHLALVVHELNHRVKNTLTIVQSIATNTLRSQIPQEEKLKLFEERLIALARTHDLLTKQGWEGANIRDIVELALAPYQQSGRQRFILCGPNIWVEAQASLSIAMALHELGTNASKYGSLSVDDGIVRITWVAENKEVGDDLEYTARLEWREEKGPPVKKPSHKGFGSRLIQRSLANDPNGDVTIDYAPQGVVCTFQWTRVKPHG